MDTVFDVDKTLVTTLVKKAIREALRTGGSGTDDPTPDWRFREMDRWHQLNQRNARRQEVAWRLMAWTQGSIISERERSLELCPCPSPPRTVRLDFVPEHLKNFLL